MSELFALPNGREFVAERYEPHDGRWSALWKDWSYVHDFDTALELARSHVLKNQPCRVVKISRYGYPEARNHGKEDKFIRHSILRVFK